MEGLAPGEKLPEDAPAARAGQDGLAAAAIARAAPKQDLLPAELDSDDESAAGTPQQPQVLTNAPSCLVLCRNLHKFVMHLMCTVVGVHLSKSKSLPERNYLYSMLNNCLACITCRWSDLSHHHIVFWVCSAPPVLFSSCNSHRLARATAAAERAQHPDDTYSGRGGRACGPHPLARRPDQGGRLSRPRRIALPGA